MAIYYDMPDDLERLRQDAKEAGEKRNTLEWKEAIVILRMGAQLKIAVDGIIGRDYSEYSPLERVRFDHRTPEGWATQIEDLIDRYGSGAASEMHISSFAHKLSCPHCQEIHGTDTWPARGDSVGFYYQKEPGNFSLRVNCPGCGKDWYVVWDSDPGQMRPLSVVKERKKVHNVQAIARDIGFGEAGEASSQCCWNCANFTIPISGQHWCVEDMMEVDRKDLCLSWRQRRT